MPEEPQGISSSRLEILTDRQRVVLDLLLEHKTSKEIARELGISPHTVDQRIRLAREKLGVERRSDLISAYKKLRGIYRKTVYEDSYIESSALPFHQSRGPGDRSDLIVDFPQASTSVEPPVASDNGRLVPAIFEGRNAVLMRVGAVFAIAAATIVVGIGGLAMFEQLSRLMM